MGIWDRFGRGTDAQSTSGGEPSTDEQAIARYRYMLRTAPPEAIEQAHAEAFAALTPEQRRKVLEELEQEMPDVERVAAARVGDSADGLARLATRAEIRQPGTMERIFGGMPRGPAWSSAAPGLGGGLGGMMAGGFLASMAGSVLGSMVAQHFFQSHPEASHLLGSTADSNHPDGSRWDDLSKGIDERHLADRGALDPSPADDPMIDAMDDDIGGGFDGGDVFDT